MSSNRNSVIQQAIEQLAQRVSNLGQEGRFAEAELLTQQGLKQYPQSAVLLNIAGVIAVQVGKPALAEEYWLKSAAQKPPLMSALQNLGKFYLDEGRYPQAERYFGKILDIKPTHLESRARLGAVFLAQDRFAEATAVFRRVLSQDPSHADTLENYGMLLCTLQHYPEAKDVFTRLSRVPGKTAEATRGFAKVAQGEGRIADAVNLYRQAIEIQSKTPGFRVPHPEWLCDYAEALESDRKFELADSAFGSALRIDPVNTRAHSGMSRLIALAEGDQEVLTYFQRLSAQYPDWKWPQAEVVRLLLNDNDFVQAEPIVDRALAIDPNEPSFMALKLDCFRRQGRFDAALEVALRAVSLYPQDYELNLNYATLSLEQGHYDDVIRKLRALLAKNPSDHRTRTHLSFALLSTGQFEEGWACFESRWMFRLGRLVEAARPATPRWQGEDLRGKRLLVIEEQGLGDEIQFFRYLPALVAEYGCEITYVCKNPLSALLQGTPGVRVLANRDCEGWPEHDTWSFLLSLPHYVGTRLDNIPAPIPYLSADPEKIEAWRKVLPADGFRVGLVWKGSRGHSNDSHRSLPSIELLAPLWQIPDLKFVSLQKGRGEDEALAFGEHKPLLHLGSEIADFADTAAVVAQLDLVICVDTAIAHLAGALGVPCWLMLPYVPDWRWLTEREDSPWYPKLMKLYRQKDFGAWPELIARVVADLSNPETRASLCSGAISRV